MAKRTRQAAALIRSRISGHGDVRPEDLGKVHQNILVFVKGDARVATDAVGPVECGDVPTEPEQE